MMMVRKFYILFCTHALLLVVQGERRNNVGWNSRRSYNDNYHHDSTTFASLGRHRLWSDGDLDYEEDIPTSDESSSSISGNDKGGRLSLSLVSPEWNAYSLSPPSSAAYQSKSNRIQLASLRTKKKKEQSTTHAPTAPTTTTQHEVDDEEEEEDDEEDTKISQEQIVQGLTLPLIPTNAWEGMTGSEFVDDSSAIDKLSRSGLLLAASQQGDTNLWVSWRATKDTEKALQPPSSLMTALCRGDILVYLGTAKKQDGFGSHLPFIKTQSILPLAAEEVADLLMDSTKVPIYNKMSLGRTDLKILNQQTKIVRNLTQPPIAKSKMVSVTLMHARPLRETDFDLLKKMPTVASLQGYLVVSRAVPGADTKYMDIPRNDILLGVNVIQELNANECLMTAVTHVYSPSLPAMLAKRVGVSGAINFVNDLRGVAAVPVSK